MKITLVGAGAIGGFLAAQLLASGTPVNMLARGQTLENLKAHGVGLQKKNAEPMFYPIEASDKAEDFGHQDLVIVCVKEPSLHSLVPQLEPLIGPNTCLMTAMNGIPWWFPEGLKSSQAIELPSLDPDQTLKNLIPAERIIGCVLHMGCTTPEPGLTRHVVGRSMFLGSAKPSAESESNNPGEVCLQELVGLLKQAEFNAKVSDHIHTDIWFKLWGNMTHNPISALTRATTDQIIHDPLTCKLTVNIMLEAQRVGAQIGCVIEQDAAARNQETLKMGAFKTSMLQDLEAGKSLEINALLGAFYDISEALDEPIPYAESLLGLVRLLARNL
ncbi:MAG: 2-dehydropantoate 2-reductase [Oceanobacter sp.]